MEQTLAFVSVASSPWRKWLADLSVLVVKARVGALSPLAPEIGSGTTIMSEILVEKICTPCRGGIPPLTRDEAQRLQAQTPDWELGDDAHRIQRTFRFRNFREALAFVQEVGELAETEGHHPDISFGWGYADISLQTKKIKGLHENDFIMAAKIDQLLAART